MSDEASTPPHHPTYNVHLAPERISHIVSTIYPDHTATAAETPRGTSYNNRIYFLDIIPNPSTSAPEPGKPLKAVLKLSGHFFNEIKVQNEVGALLLLARHCPCVPAPLVLAWSENGRTISTQHKTIPDISQVEAERTNGWILMTHLPGRILTTADLDSPSGPRILHQIAQSNVSWRTVMPTVPMFGNIRQRSHEEGRLVIVRPYEPSPFNQGYTVGGFLLCHRYDPKPILTASDYYTYMLKDQVHRVMTSKQFDTVRCDIVPLIAEFVDTDLPHMSCLQQTCGPILQGVFSHMDLAPRNILVQDDEQGGLNVTGIIDFEFAAFLPPMDEFVNAYVRQDDDWEERHYRLLLQDMAALGCEVPPLEGGISDQKSFGKQEWKETCVLWRLIDNIAPWYVMDGNMGRKELQEELEKAGKIVRNCIRELQKLRSLPEQSQPTTPAV